MKLGSGTATFAVAWWVGAFMGALLLGDAEPLKESAVRFCQHARDFSRDDVLKCSRKGSSRAPQPLLRRYAFDLLPFLHQCTTAARVTKLRSAQRVDPVRAGMSKVLAQLAPGRQHADALREGERDHA